MSKKIKFDDVEMMERLFEQLSAEDASESVTHGFREWEILHELDRQQHRKEYDKSPERLTEREKQRVEAERVRRYLAEHPEVEVKLKDKVKV